MLISNLLIVINGVLLAETTLYNRINKIFIESGFGYTNGTKIASSYPGFVIDINYPVSTKNRLLDPQRCIYSEEVSIRCDPLFTSGSNSIKDFDYIANLINTICKKFLTSNGYRFVTERDKNSKSLLPQTEENLPTSIKTGSGDAFVYSNVRMAFHSQEELRGRSALVREIYSENLHFLLTEHQSHNPGPVKSSTARLSIKQNDTSVSLTSLYHNTIIFLTSFHWPV